MQGLQGISKLNEGDFVLFGASGESIRAEAVGTMLLKLPSGKILELKDCYYMPSIIRNIISVPILLEHDFKIKGKDKGCFIYHFNEFYGTALVDNDILFLLLNDNVLHIDQMKKRKKEDLNVTTNLVILMS